MRLSVVLSGLVIAGVAHRTEAQQASPPTSPAATPTLPDTAAVTPAIIDAGRAIFHGPGTCFMCHGANLEGGPIAPTLLSHKWKDAVGGTLPAIYHVATHGVTGTAMQPHPGGISDSTAMKVAAYVWAVGHGKAKP